MALQKCVNGLKSKLTVILGSQWGDEGKGKLVSYLSEHYDIAARFNGGANAGHTVHKKGVKYAFHLVPSGILCPNTKNLLGNGTVINLESLFNELSQLDKHKISYKDRIFLSARAHIVTRYQLEEDVGNEEKQGLGTTKKGIGPTYAAKTQRYGLRIGDLKNWDTFEYKFKHMTSFYSKDHKSTAFNADFEQYKYFKELQSIKNYRNILMKENMIVDSVGWVNNSLQQGKRLLAEGANASMLDLDLGTYPYVTSSSTTAGGCCTGLGIAPSKLETIIGVAKAYTTRVGAGPFPTELNDKTGQLLRSKGHEFGTTTARPRRCGWLDLMVLKYTNMINGYTSLNLTKLDILDDLEEIKVGVSYKLDGKQIDTVPTCLEDLDRVEVVYETLKGWKKDISKITKPEDLPKEAIDYIRFIEKHVGVPISWVGTGPSELAMIRMI